MIKGAGSGICTFVLFCIRGFGNDLDIPTSRMIFGSMDIGRRT